jgi:hypothetical protein
MNCPLSKRVKLEIRLEIIIFAGKIRHSIGRMSESDNSGLGLSIVKKNQSVFHSDKIHVHTYKNDGLEFLFMTQNIFIANELPETSKSVDILNFTRIHTLNVVVVILF